MAGTKETNCPNCGRHCSVEDLHCPRGRAYFGIEESQSNDRHSANHNTHGHGPHHGDKHDHHRNADMTIDDKVVQLMRAVGHSLHHGSETDNARLMSALNDDEKHTLIGILKKCLKSWNE